jgi:nucleoside-diphosphate-sugar epimerase
MTAIEQTQQQLVAQPRRWLVTGSAGFIGSHLVEALLRLDQTVTGLDSFATGHRRNVDEKAGWLLSRLLPPETPLDPDDVEDMIPEPGTWLDRLFRDPVHIGRQVVRRATRRRRRSA